MKIDWKKAKPHRVWLGILILAVFLIGVKDNLLNYLARRSERHAIETGAALAASEDTLRQIDADMETARQLRGTMNTRQIEQALAPADRLRVGSSIEQIAAATRLRNLTYTLSPEQPQTQYPDISGLVASTVTVNAEAPLDTDAYRFIDQLTQRLPGRLQLRQIILEPIGQNAAQVSAYNMRMTAVFEWLSNPSSQTMADGT